MGVGFAAKYSINGALAVGAGARVVRFKWYAMHTVFSGVSWRFCQHGLSARAKMEWLDLIFMSIVFEFFVVI
jgi:hypothetical protein